MKKGRKGTEGYGGLFALRFWTSSSTTMTIIVPAALQPGKQRSQEGLDNKTELLNELDHLVTPVVD
jgi:hypothetical protein